MRNGILILVSATFITGCAERGYRVSTNSIKHTASAQYSIPLTAKVGTESKKREAMSNSVKKVLLSKNTQVSTLKKPSKVIIDVPDIDLNNQYQSPIQNIHFTRINSIYQNFGNSEIHGHVIYLTKHGEETHLNNTRIYILPPTNKIENWYTNNYLRDTASEKDLAFQYLNATSLNLNQNFTFYGISEGEYFIIIISTTSNDFNKKVYITKKIHVDKHQKIMAVFSKKL